MLNYFVNFASLADALDAHGPAAFDAVRAAVQAFHAAQPDPDNESERVDFSVRILDAGTTPAEVAVERAATQPLRRGTVFVSHRWHGRNAIDDRAGRVAAAISEALDLLVSEPCDTDYYDQWAERYEGGSFPPKETPRDELVVWLDFLSFHGRITPAFFDLLASLVNDAYRCVCLVDLNYLTRGWCTYELIHMYCLRAPILLIEAGPDVIARSHAYEFVFHISRSGDSMSRERADLGAPLTTLNDFELRFNHDVDVIGEGLDAAAAYRRKDANRDLARAAWLLSVDPMVPASTRQILARTPARALWNLPDDILEKPILHLNVHPGRKPLLASSDPIPDLLGEYLFFSVAEDKHVLVEYLSIGDNKVGRLFQVLKDSIIRKELQTAGLLP